MLKKHITADIWVATTMSEDEREKEFSTVLAESVVATDLFEVKKCTQTQYGFLLGKIFSIMFSGAPKTHRNIDLAEELTH